MQPDPKFLKKQYASMSDEALLEIDRSELVDVAQQCYDAELRERGLSSGETSGEKPEWIEDASEVFSVAFLEGAAPSADAEDARKILEEAGVPAYLEITELEERRPARQATHLMKLLVPGKLNMQASSILDRDLYNEDFENSWRAHLEMLSDEELRDMHPKTAFCGLYDRIERIENAYREELARRGVESDPSTA